jgi:hypothetical protein
MFSWNYDIEAGKKAGRVIVCVDNDTQWMGFSEWQNADPVKKITARWTFLAAGQEPLAWMKLEHAKQMGKKQKRPPTAVQGDLPLPKPRARQRAPQGE